MEKQALDGIAESDVRSGTAADDATIGTLREELEAATSAAFKQLRMIAATASVEARLSIASAMSIATARSLSVAFLVVAWFCLMALTVLALVRAGLSAELCLLAMAVINVAISAALHRWQKWLVGNIGLPRTRKLLRQLPATKRVKNQ